MNFSRLSIPERVSLGAMVVVAIAAFLPWVSIFGIGVRGTEGDGVITLILALLGIAILAATSPLFKAGRTTGKPAKIALAVLAVVVAVIGLADMNGAAAIGLYLTLFAGITWAVAAIWQFAVDSRQRDHA